MACIKKYTDGSFYTCCGLDNVYYDRPVVVLFYSDWGQGPCRAQAEIPASPAPGVHTRESSGQQTAGNIPAGVSDKVSIGVSRDW